MKTPLITINIDVNTDPNYLTIKVMDAGVGLQSAEINSIFSSLPSIKTGTSNEKGTGLALSLSKEFAELNNAKIGYLPNQP